MYMYVHVKLYYRISNSLTQFVLSIFFPLELSGKVSNAGNPCIHVQYYLTLTRLYSRGYNVSFLYIS